MSNDIELRILVWGTWIVQMITFIMVMALVATK